MPLTSEEKRELILGMATAETVLGDCALELARALRQGRPNLISDCRPTILYSPMDCASLGLLLRHREENA